MYNCTYKDRCSRVDGCEQCLIAKQHHTKHNATHAWRPTKRRLHPHMTQVLPLTLLQFPSRKTICKESFLATCHKHMTGMHTWLVTSTTPLPLCKLAQAAHVPVCKQTTHSPTDPSTSTRHASTHYLHASTMISVEFSESNVLEFALMCV